MYDNPFCLGEPSLGESSKESKKMESLLAIFSDVQLLNFWLSRFIVEAQREDGKPYPVSTIQNIMAGLYRYSKTKAPSGTVVPNTCDSIFRDLMLIGWSVNVWTILTSWYGLSWSFDLLGSQATKLFVVLQRFHVFLQS